MKLEAGAVAIGLIAAGSGALSTFLQEQGIVVSAEILIGMGVNFVVLLGIAVKLIADSRIMRHALDELLAWKKEQEKKEDEEARVVAAELRREQADARRRDLRRRDQPE